MGSVTPQFLLKTNVNLLKDLVSEPTTGDCVSRDGPLSVKGKVEWEPSKRNSLCLRTFRGTQYPAP